MKRSYKSDQKHQFSNRKWTKWGFSFEKYHTRSSDIKRIDIAKIIVGFKLMILKFQSKIKNQKYPQFVIIKYSDQMLFLKEY